MYSGAWLVWWLARSTANREVRGSNPGQGRNLVRDFCFTCAPSQPSYEYTDRTWSVGRYGGEGGQENEVANTSSPWAAKGYSSSSWHAFLKIFPPMCLSVGFFLRSYRYNYSLYSCVLLKFSLLCK